MRADHDRHSFSLAYAVGDRALGDWRYAILSRMAVVISHEIVDRMRKHHESDTEESRNEGSQAFLVPGPTFAWLRSLPSSHGTRRRNVSGRHPDPEARIRGRAAGRRASIRSQGGRDQGRDGGSRGRALGGCRKNAPRFARHVSSLLDAFSSLIDNNCWLWSHFESSRRDVRSSDGLELVDGVEDHDSGPDLRRQSRQSHSWKGTRCVWNLYRE